VKPTGVCNGYEKLNGPSSRRLNEQQMVGSFQIRCLKWSPEYRAKIGRRLYSAPRSPTPWSWVERTWKLQGCEPGVSKIERSPVDYVYEGKKNISQTNNTYERKI